MTALFSSKLMALMYGCAPLHCAGAPYNAMEHSVASLSHSRCCSSRLTVLRCGEGSVPEDVIEESHSVRALTKQDSGFKLLTLGVGSREGDDSHRD